MKTLPLPFRFTKNFFVVALSVMSHIGFAQRAKTHTMTSDEAKTVKKDASTMFSIENYNGALAGYDDLVKNDPTNTEYNYRLGYCYLQTNVNKVKAIEYFQAASKLKNPRKETKYFLGVAYMYAQRWDDAIQAFDEYKVSTHSRQVKDFPDVSRQMEMCENGKELTKHPVNVTFENLGKGINTSFEDYNPFISADEKTLIFTSRRKGNLGGFIDDIGVYSADVYYSVWKDTVWTKAKSTGAGINTEWDEEAVGLSADGNMAFIYFDNIEASGDVAVSTSKGKTWQKAVLFAPPVNTKEFESSACMTLDGSAIYFASERKDSRGGRDIYMSKRKSSSEWGPAVNLGDVINTKEDDDAPFISMDEKTLYFSSKGHNSMGGFDVFRSTFDETTGGWSKPVNIGYPLNDADDNLFFSLTGDQRHAYIAATRDGGMGDKDIYRVTYNDTIDHPFLALVSGTVTSETNAKVEITEVNLKSKQDSTLRMTYKASSGSNEFILSAKPGEYILTVEGYNFQPYSESFTIANEFPLKSISKKIIVKPGKQ